MMEENKQGQFILSSGDGAQPYNYAVGTWGSKFLTELRDKEQILGIRCPKCRTVYVPPRQVCGPCFTEMTELVPVASEGKIVSYTILRFQFLDPETGEKKPVPYGYGFFKLDGADNNFQHFIEVPEDESRLYIGARVKAVFAEKKQGSLQDIKHFTLVNE
ncbi:MAG TPA: OB-fold domain-containing protein [Turneriella sp.]|nr:OB-fold domain-containing protein [Turneriella sp.]HNA77989.1 OB-fold domain-containing protein [Turneriella sp.]HNE19056.1 OB-fold domain-containing protein [Turneriella sp.]HNJ65003.1 OB-fold domain-containing protein [Turneriella sp.]HNL10796.1 OB-fold domain-containing protein [Turneriella sp.]